MNHLEAPKSGTEALCPYLVGSVFSYRHQPRRRYRHFEEEVSAREIVRRASIHGIKQAVGHEIYRIHFMF